MKSPRYLAVNSEHINQIPFLTWIPLIFGLVLLVLFIMGMLGEGQRILKKKDMHQYFLNIAFIIGSIHFITYIILGHAGFYFTNIDGIMFGITPLSFTLSSIMAGILILLLLVFYACHTETRNVELILMAIMCVFAYLTFFFFEFISIFLLLEIITLILYVLASMHNGYRTAATMKYAIFSMISAGIILFGAFLVYVDIGVLNFVDWESSICSSLGAVGFALIYVGLLLKVGCFPFSWWVLDVYTSSSDFAVVIYTVFTKVYILGLFIHIFVHSPVSGFDFIYTQILFFIFGVGSSLFGVLCALSATKVRDLIIGSGFVPLGYFLIAFSTTYSAGTLLAYLYILIYSVNICFLFFLMFHCTPKAFSSAYEHPWLRNISDFTGLFYVSSWLWNISFILCMFSLIGIPPSVGFVSKILLSSGVYYLGYVFSASIIFVISVFASFYYLRVLRYFFMREKHNSSLDLGKINFHFSFTQYALCLLFVVMNLGIIFMYPKIIAIISGVFF